jgi:hypothetical protein
VTLFAPLFSKSVFQHVQVLVAGAILAPGKRTVASAALRAMGLEEERCFCRYHRVLSRATWSSREASRLLLGLLVEAFVPEGPLVLGVDETLERRRGKKVVAKGIISWFVRRWQMEANFQEVRQRLGFETQRQWSEKAIQRTAPALLGLFSLITLFAHRQMAQEGSRTIRRAAWYDKSRPTFTDALALVRKELWACTPFRGSLSDPETVKVPKAFMERLTDAVCYAA